MVKGFCYPVHYPINNYRFTEKRDSDCTSCHTGDSWSGDRIIFDVDN